MSDGYSYGTVGENIEIGGYNVTDPGFAQEYMEDTYGMGASAFKDYKSYFDKYDFTPESFLIDSTQMKLDMLNLNTGQGLSDTLNNKFNIMEQNSFNAHGNVISEADIANENTLKTYKTKKSMDLLNLERGITGLQENYAEDIVNMGSEVHSLWEEEGQDKYEEEQKKKNLFWRGAAALGATIAFGPVAGLAVLTQGLFPSGGESPPTEQY